MSSDTDTQGAPADPPGEEPTGVAGSPEAEAEGDAAASTPTE